MAQAKKIFWYLLLAALAISFGPQLIKFSAEFISASVTSAVRNIFLQ